MFVEPLFFCTRMPLQGSNASQPVHRGLLPASLRLFFRYFYHELAWTYDPVASLVSLGRWDIWVQAAISFVKGIDVLELGFGPGHLQAKLVGAGFRTTGIDESSQMVRRASSRLKTLGGAEPQLVRGLAQDLPFGKQAFDTIVSTFPSEYIFERRTLDEARRVLRDDGTLVIIPAASIVGKQAGDRIAAWIFRVTHEAPASPEEVFSARLEARLQEAGWEGRFHTLELRSSLVFIIEAQKLASSS